MQTKTTKHLRFCAKRLKNLFVAPKVSDYTHLKTVQRQYDAHTTFHENPSFHGTNVQCHDVYFHVGQNLNESWTDGRTDGRAPAQKTRRQSPSAPWTMGT